MINSCVDKCPAKIKDQDVVEDKSSRRCIVQSDRDTILNKLFSENLEHTPKSILDQIRELKIKYNMEINNNKAQNRMKNEQSGNSEDVSSECYYKGKLHKIFTGNSNGYYICRCSKGYIGDNC